MAFLCNTNRLLSSSGGNMEYHHSQAAIAFEGRQRGTVRISKIPLILQFILPRIIEFRRVQIIWNVVYYVYFINCYKMVLLLYIPSIKWLLRAFKFLNCAWIHAPHLSKLMSDIWWYSIRAYAMYTHALKKNSDVGKKISRRVETGIQPDLILEIRLTFSFCINVFSLSLIQCLRYFLLVYLSAWFVFGGD